MPLPPLSPRTPATARHRSGLAGAFLTLWLACAQPAVAQLPPQIEADRLLLEASTEMAKEKDISWPRVLHALEAAEATGVRMPENFNYHIGLAHRRWGEAEAARQRLERYLAAQGSSAKYYKEALESLTAVKKRLDSDTRRGAWQRFEWADQANGELRDRKTGLIWQFCQSDMGRWNGKRCDGRYFHLTWDKANELARTGTVRSGKPWRLPTRAELLDAAGVLPETGITWTWTSTAKSDGLVHVVGEYSAEKELLGERPSGESIENDFYKTQSMAVRLVR